MKRCDKTGTDDYDNMMCYDEIKKGAQIGNLSGDYFMSKNKTTMKFSLRKCVNSETNKCASKE